MQRLHEDDLAGKLLSEAGWHHLDLPAIAEDDQEIPIGPGVIHRRQKGEVLHPAREPLALLEEIKREMGSLTFSAQYLQRPVPLEGNLIKREWIKWYETAPNRSSARRSSRAGTSQVPRPKHGLVRVHHVAEGQAKLLSSGRLARAARVSSLRRKLIEPCKQHKPSRILIEQAGPGLHMIQELRANPPRRSPPHRHQARGRQTRAHGSPMRAL